MTKASILMVVAMATGCAARQTSPVARQQAVQLFASGVPCDEIATKLNVDREHARELIRIGMADLNRKFYKTR